MTLLFGIYLTLKFGYTTLQTLKDSYLNIFTFTVQFLSYNFILENFYNGWTKDIFNKGKW